MKFTGMFGSLLFLWQRLSAELRNVESRPGLRPIFKSCRFAVRLVRRVRDWVPLTPLGAIVIVALIWLFRTVGVERNDRIVLAICMTGACLTGICQLCVLSAALWLRFRRQGKAADRLDLIAEAPFRTGYQIGIASWNPLLHIESAWERPVEASVRLLPHRGGACEKVTVHRRGDFDHIVRTFIVTDVLGLCRCAIRRRSGQRVFIKPAGGNAPCPSVAESAAAGEQRPHPDGKPEGDLIETRRYVPGDPLKFVLWKVYARTGQLLVRSPERTLATSRRVLAYFVAGPGDEPTAAAARAMLENGSLGTDFLFAADGSPAPVRTPREAVDSIVRSATSTDQGGQQLADFLAQGARMGFNSCVLYVPGRAGEWLDHVAEALAGYRGKCRVIVGSDAGPASQPAAASPLQRFICCLPAVAGQRQNAESVCDRLARCGAQVTLVDRTRSEVREVLPREA